MKEDNPYITIFGIALISLFSFVGGMLYDAEILYQPETSDNYGYWANISNESNLEYLEFVCDKFFDVREYIQDSYVCHNFSDDFSQLGQLIGYDVYRFDIFPSEGIGHSFNYINISGNITYIEPQGCYFFSNLSYFYEQHFNESYDLKTREVYFK